MKRTVIMQEIDGIEVIRGFDRPCVDPVETRKKTEAAIEADPIMEEKKNLADKRDKLLKKMAPKMQALIAHDKKGNIESPEAKKLIVELQTIDLEVGDLVIQIKDLIKRLKDRYSALKAENLVYFEPKIGEEVIEDDEYNDLMEAFKNMGPNHRLKRDKKTVHDFRGLKYWIKENGEWNPREIKKLNEKPPAGWKKSEELTDQDKDEIRQQIEEERIYNLSPDARENEKSKVIDRLKLTAQAKITFDAKEDQEKIDQVHAWLEEQKAIVEAKYNI